MLHFLLTITPSKPGSVWCHCTALTHACKRLAGPRSAGALLPLPPLPCLSLAMQRPFLQVVLWTCRASGGGQEAPHHSRGEDGRAAARCWPLMADRPARATGPPGSSVRRCHGWARPGHCCLQKPAPKLTG